MNIPLSLRFALGFYRGRKRNSSMSFLHIISILGNVLGVSVLIIGLSAVNGFQYELEHRFLAMIPHIEIESIDSLFGRWRNIFDQIKKIPEVLSVSFYINFMGFVEYENKSYPLYIKGIDLLQDMHKTIIPNKKDINIRQIFKSGYQYIILNKEIANILQIKENDWVTIVVPNSCLNGQLLFPKYIRLQVIGFFSLGSALDCNFALVPLKDAQVYLNKKQIIDGIAIKVNNIFEINKITEKLIRIINDKNIYINNWMCKYGYIYKDILMIRVIIYLSMFLVILVSSISMIGLLMILIKDKIRDIAILISLGAKTSLIRNIFIWRSLLTGLFGIFIGVFLGILFSLNLTTLTNKLAYVIGHPLLSENAYFINFIPSILLFNDIFRIVCIVFLLNLLISWYPILYINRIDSSRILR